MSGASHLNAFEPPANAQNPIKPYVIRFRWGQGLWSKIQGIGVPGERRMFHLQTNDVEKTWRCELRIEME